jgi:fatty-acid desaturase
LIRKLAAAAIVASPQAVGLAVEVSQKNLSAMLMGFVVVPACMSGSGIGVAFGHISGRRRFETPDDSHNNWWVALLTFGEGWHNNHHACPSAARHGLVWYELDINRPSPDQNQ